MRETCLNIIGGAGYFGQTDILPVVLGRYRKKLLKNISAIRAERKEGRVSTHLKECGFTASLFIKEVFECAE